MPCTPGGTGPGLRQALRPRILRRDRNPSSPRTTSWLGAARARHHSLVAADGARIATGRPASDGIIEIALNLGTTTSSAACSAKRLTVQADLADRRPRRCPRPSPDTDSIPPAPTSSGKCQSPPRLNPASYRGPPPGCWRLKTAELSRQLTTPNTPTDADVLGASQSPSSPSPEM
jgi:hypothetical protein